MKRTFWIWVLIVGVLAACSVPEAPGIDPSPGLDPTIVNGEETTPHEFPSMVRLNSNANASFANCGGSILSETWILTAAHCVDEDVTSIFVTAGDHQISDRNEGEQIIESERILIDDRWTGSFSVGYDVALIELSEPLEYNENIQPTTYGSELPPVGTVLEAIGWGRDENDERSDVLQKVDITIEDPSECSNANAEFCAVQDGNNTGRGDSGGPLFEDGVIVGLTSNGGGGSDYYTDVPAVSEWIEATSGIAPDGSGSEPDPSEPTEPEPEPEPEPDPDTMMFEGSLEEGDVVLQPDDTFFELDGPATLSGILSGPADANFDLFLYEWDGGQWVQVARGANADSEEDLSYEADAQYYAWLLFARSGSGDYTLDLTNAAR